MGARDFCTGAAAACLASIRMRGVRAIARNSGTVATGAAQNIWKFFLDSIM